MSVLNLSQNTSEQTYEYEIPWMLFVEHISYNTLTDIVEVINGF